MEELKIVGWVDFDSEYPTRKFKGEEFNEIIYKIRLEISEKEYIFSGEEHQYSFTGAPLFSDGTCFRASMRAWGSIMASVYAGPNGEKLDYMDFYMSLGEDSVLPEYEEYDIAPARVEEESFGCTLKPDRDLIDQSLAMGMDLMTTDKVIKKLFEEKKNKQ
ncbi:MAG: hypothetical protein IJ309_01445 [Clostridia bacterium]|nr:hypothetical protein [Clostridia bacterium]